MSISRSFNIHEDKAPHIALYRIITNFDRQLIDLKNSDDDDMDSLSIKEAREFAHCLLLAVEDLKAAPTKNEEKTT